MKTGEALKSCFCLAICWHPYAVARTLLICQFRLKTLRVVVFRGRCFREYAFCSRGSEASELPIIEFVVINHLAAHV